MPDPDPDPDHAATATATEDQERRNPRAILKALGPGLVAGASDNDPTTVASLSVIGATTIYRLSWLVILVIPMLVIVQVVSATVGVVARGGLEDVVRHRYGKAWAFLVCCSSSPSTSSRSPPTSKGAAPRSVS